MNYKCIGWCKPDFELSDRIDFGFFIVRRLSALIKTVKSNAVKYQDKRNKGTPERKTSR